MKFYHVHTAIPVSIQDTQTVNEDGGMVEVCATLNAMIDSNLTIMFSTSDVTGEQLTVREREG